MWFKSIEETTTDDPKVAGSSVALQYTVSVQKIATQNVILMQR